MNPGLHLNVPAAQYHMDPAPQPSLSSSVAQILLTSPRKAWYAHPRLNPDYRDNRDPKFAIGTCAHAVVLENDAARIVVVQADDWRTNKAKEQRDAANAAGKTALLEKHFDAVRKMADTALAFVAQSEIADAWKDGDSEVTGIAQERAVWLRARFDRLSKDRRFIIDYKSTTDASPEGFSRQIARMSYHIQDAFYRRVLSKLEGNTPRFAFLVQEDEPPYECSLAACSTAMQEIADAEAERAIETWRRGINSGKWIGYPNRICYAEPTTYMMQEHELRLLERAA